jgi:hypothetical protein
VWLSKETILKRITLNINMFMFMVLHISEMCLSTFVFVLHNNPINYIQYLMYSAS